MACSWRSGGTLRPTTSKTPSDRPPPLATAGTPNDSANGAWAGFGPWVASSATLGRLTVPVGGCCASCVDAQGYSSDPLQFASPDGTLLTFDQLPASSTVFTANQ